MKMKRYLALVAILVMLTAAMTGCTSQPSAAAPATAADAAAEEASAAPAAEEVVTLTVWGDPDNQAIQEDCFKELNALFEAKNPNIKLDYQWSGSFDGINIALQSDTLPDLFGCRAIRVRPWPRWPKRDSCFHWISSTRTQPDFRRARSTMHRLTALRIARILDSSTTR